MRKLISAQLGEMIQVRQANRELIPPSDFQNLLSTVQLYLEQKKTAYDHSCYQSA